VAEGDSGFAQIVRGHFHVHFVTDADAYEILPHFAGDMGENFVSGRQGNAETSYLATPGSPSQSILLALPLPLEKIDCQGPFCHPHTMKSTAF